MDSVVGLAKQYREEFECELVQLRKQAALVSEEFATKAHTYQQLNEVQRELTRRRNGLLELLRDKSTLCHLDTYKLLDTFAWIGVMLLGMTAGGLIGGVIMSPIIGLFISGQDAALVAYVILPILAAYFVARKPDDETGDREQTPHNDDLLRRHTLFSFAAIEGFLTGFIFSHKALISLPPPAAITPIAIGVIAHVASESIKNDRIKLIWLTIGGSLVLHLTIGTVLELTLPYLTLALTYAAIGFVALQLYIDSASKNNKWTHMYQLGFVCAVLLSQAVIYTIFGMDEKELSEAQKTM